MNLIQIIPKKKTLRFESRLGNVEIRPLNNKIETKAVVSSLAEPLKLRIISDSEEIALALLSKAKKKLIRSEQVDEKYEDAKQILQSIKNILRSTSKDECIELLRQMFLDV